MDEIVRDQSAVRGITPQLAREYLTRHIVFELNDRDHEGLNLYLKHAARAGGASI